MRSVNKSNAARRKSRERQYSWNENMNPNSFSRNRSGSITLDNYSKKNQKKMEKRSRQGSVTGQNIS
jgi:hypothetical protein